MGGHNSEPQNLIVANVLYKSAVLESWGRGIALMINECRRVGIPDPEFHTDGNAVWVVFHYTRTTVGQATGQVTGQVATLVTCLGTDMLSAKELMERLSLKGRDNFLNSYLNPALDEGYIEQTHPENPKHPKQKYRLSDKGRELL